MSHAREAIIPLKITSGTAHWYERKQKFNINCKIPGVQDCRTFGQMAWRKGRLSHHRF